MKITGAYTLNAPRDRAWPIIFDPVRLMGLIPGCEQIEADGPDSYRGAITLRLPAVSGTYRTAIKIVDRREPEFCRLSGEAAGPGGSVTGKAAFTLHEVDGGTLVEYDGDAIISGPLGGMNPRFIEGVAQQLIKQGLARLNVQAVAAMAEEAESAPPSRPGLWARFVAWLRGAIGRMFPRRGAV
jgi:carbon monoxide dehydrogenase subunit G